jgi:hypothetical protein
LVGVLVTDDIEIMGGGAVAVDTATLRQTAGRFIAAGADLAQLHSRLGALQSMLFVQRDVAWDAGSAVSELWAAIAETMKGAGHIAEQLRGAAAIYELVELNVQHRAAFFSGDAASADRIDMQRRELMASYPGIVEQAQGLEAERIIMWPSELTRQATELGFAVGEEFGGPAAIVGGAVTGLSTLAFAATAGITGQGLVPRDARLSGTGGRVTISPVKPQSRATTAPVSIADAASRIPDNGASRVRVERYGMPDGSRQFVVYVAGTQSMAAGGRDPWDNRSNTELYLRTSSSSFVATERALEAAGARPGDVVHAFGHSQGAMIAAHLTLEGGYDTRTLVSLGSPVEADVAPATLSVGIRHTDDPVAALAGGGHLTPVGAPGSFVAERSHDPATGVHDGRLTAHGLAAYVETARMVDASGDPRVAAVNDVLSQLGQAQSVDVVEYSASRVSPISSAGAG